MKRLVTIFGMTFLSFNAFAGGYNFECSNKNGSIAVSARGDEVRVYDKTYTLDVKLTGLEIWAPLEDRAETELISTGKRTVLLKQTDNSCRDTGTLVFAQKLTIRDMKTKKEIASDYFICENSYATSTGGRDCGADAVE